ncbi:MAG: arylsulfatase A-like enzyme [Pseudohongiellaceae bacterium]|jgi:arylsulfatase A-like enzyme
MFAAICPTLLSRVTLCFAVVQLCLCGCADPAATEGQSVTRPPGSPVELFEMGPGDVLLDHLDRLQPLSAAASNLAPGTRSAIDDFLGNSRQVIPATDWVAGKAVDAATVEVLGLQVSGPLLRFRCRPPLRLDLGLGRVRLRHGERKLSSSEGEVGDRRLWWFDRSLPMAFRWDGELGALFAFGAEPPKDIVVEYDAAAAADLLHWEGPDAGLSKERRLSLDQVDRPALAVTTPSSFQWRLDRLSGATLDVSVAALDVGLVLDSKGRLARRPGLGDGVTFAVDITAGGVTTRLWERHVEPGSHWTDERIPLPQVGPVPVALRFTTLAGPNNQRLNDHALWSGLRIRGNTLVELGKPHIILLDLDTLRADRLGCYGAERSTSPRIDAWAAESAQLFENASSVESWTLPSTISMLTGLAVSQHGVHFSTHRMTSDMEPLAQRLSAAGYETYGRSDGGFVIPAMGFSEGFERFLHRPLVPGEDWSEVLDWLGDRDTSQPVFCFLQTYGPHEPYLEDEGFDDPDRPYQGPLAGQQLTGYSFEEGRMRDGGPLTEADLAWVRTLYDSAVFRTDAMVGDFLDGLKGIFGEEPYVVLLTSDHGQALFERGGFGHGRSLHPEELHVPLILQHEGAAVVGRTSVPVTGLDVVPTLLDAAGLQIPEQLPGRSLLQPLPDVAAQVAWHRDDAHSIQLDGYKLIRQQGRLMLFELSDDPDERNDLAESMPSRVQRLDRLLTSWLEHWGPLESNESGAVLLSDEDKEALEALGYLR